MKLKVYRHMSDVVLTSCSLLGSEGVDKKKRRYCLGLRVWGTEQDRRTNYGA